MKRIKFIVTLLLAGLVAVSMSGCSSPSQQEKRDVVNFYIGFAKEATSLDSSQIRAKYSVLAGEDFTGQNANAARDKMFSEFNSINPEFFAKLHLTDSSYAEVGKTYSTILLMSLATGGTGIDLTMPIDAVSAHQDEKLGMVYEIDRSKITATVPEDVAAKITRSDRLTLSPIRIIKDGGSWKVLADNNMLSEIGSPIAGKISASTTK